MTDTLFPLDDYTDEGAVSLASARRLLTEVEWLDEPDDDLFDWGNWWPRWTRTRTLAVSLGATAVVAALDDLGDADMNGRFGIEHLGIVAVRAARDFLRAKERA